MLTGLTILDIAESECFGVWSSCWTWIILFISCDYNLGTVVVENGEAYLLSKSSYKLNRKVLSGKQTWLPLPEKTQKNIATDISKNTMYMLVISRKWFFISTKNDKKLKNTWRIQLT